MRDLRQKVTLKDLAEATGFSVNTVSRALRGKDDISPETRRIIEQAQIDMGYISNSLASSLRRGYTNTIAVIIGDIANPHFGILMRNIDHHARKYGYDSILMTTNEEEDLEKHAIQANVDKICTIMRGCRMSPGEVVIRCRPFFIYNGPAIRRVVDFVGNKASNMGHISTADTEKRKALYGLMEDTDDPRTDIWLRRFMEAAYLENPDLRLDMENGSGEGWTVLQADRRILGHPYQAEP